MIRDHHDQLPVEQRVAHALAIARMAGTTAAALDALCATLGWQDELAARTLTPAEHASARREIAAASHTLSELGLSAQRSPPAGPSDALADLCMACEWIVLHATQEMPETTAWVARWLARAEQLASSVLPALGELSLLQVVEGGHPLNHTCRSTMDLLPELAARCEALWTSWSIATREHPVVRDALALRDQVRERGWRYPELVAHARGLAERHEIALAAILDWILGSEPLPLGPSDARERLDGRTGYAHSGPDAVLAALSLLDVGPGDVFYDLGSGLGLPCLVAALGGHATYRGIEFHARYVDRARDNARQLGLTHVEFLIGDVVASDWSDGTRFYMFNPFPEAVLQVVAARLRQIAAHRQIRIACFHNLLPHGFTRIGGDGPIAVYEAGSRPAR
jgi:SAM-dependent methyltransferase